KTGKRAYSLVTGPFIPIPSKADRGGPMPHTCASRWIPVRSYWGVVTILAVGCGLVSSVLAFKPTAEFGHVGIVTGAITPITRTSSTGEALKFTPRAIRQIPAPTAGVDERVSSRGESSSSR